MHNKKRVCYIQCIRKKLSGRSRQQLWVIIGCARDEQSNTSPSKNIPANRDKH